MAHSSRHVCILCEGWRKVIFKWKRKSKLGHWDLAWVGMLGGGTGPQHWGYRRNSGNISGVSPKQNVLSNLEGMPQMLFPPEFEDAMARPMPPPAVGGTRRGRQGGDGNGADEDRGDSPGDGEENGVLGAAPFSSWPWNCHHHFSMMEREFSNAPCPVRRNGTAGGGKTCCTRQRWWGEGVPAAAGDGRLWRRRSSYGPIRPSWLFVIRRVFFL